MPRLIISEPGKSPQPYRLNLVREFTKIGRGADNDIQTSAGSTSTHHCVMKRVAGGFILEDLQSTNGIKHEGARFTIIDLSDGITVHLGDDVTLNFTLSDEEKEELATEKFHSHQQMSLPPMKEQAPPVVTLEDEDFDDDDDEAFFADPPSKKKDVSVFEDSFVDDDEEEYEEEEAPKSQRNRHADDSARVSSRSHAAPKSNGMLATLIFLILATLAFVGGMVIRHYQDHGTFLFDK